MPRRPFPSLPAAVRGAYGDGRGGLHAWWTAARFALAGLDFAWRTQRNFRIEVVCGGLALALALALRAPLSPILLASALVLSLELLNTALEALVDLVSPDFHPLAKVAKDAAAGAVLLASLGALLIGLVEFAPRLLALLRS